MIKCIAIDDEKWVLDLLVDNIQQVPYLQLAGRCRNALEAAAVMHSQQVDLLFIDIQMPGINGLQFIQSLTNPPLVIFVTAYKDYALEGFESNAVDYLLKPVSFERFLKACNKAKDLISLKQKHATTAELPAFFFVYVEYNQVRITIADIVYIEAMKDYIKIFLTNTSRPVITKMSMKAMEEKLSGHRFARIHKSYIVAADKIVAIKRDLVNLSKIELPVSETYRSNLDNILLL